MTDMQLFKNDEDIQNFFTEKIVYWLLKHEYSKNHWKTVHDELLTEHANATLDDLTHKFAASLEAFHVQYRDAVVKEDNLFHDMITVCYSQINWNKVSAEFIRTL